MQFADVQKKGKRFHERAGPRQVILWAGSPMRPIADQREARALPLPFLLRKVFAFFAHRRLALLPFALLMEHSAPVPVGVLNLKRVLPSQYRTERSRFGSARSAATSQSPELGDWLHNIYNPLSCSVFTAVACLAVAQRLVHFPRHPQPMQQNRQLPRHRHDRSLLRILAAARRQLQPPPLQIRIRPPPAQNTVRSLHQQLPQIDVAFLGDPQLRLALPRLAPLGRNPT